MADADHRLPVRVYYEDTDAGGIVYHTAYMRFAERGRTEFLRGLGYDHVTMRAEAGGVFVVTRCQIDYLRPARLDDALEVETRLVEARGASARMAQTVLRDGDELVRLDVRLAFMGAGGRPARIPDPVRHAFAGAAVTP